MQVEHESENRADTSRAPTSVDAQCGIAVLKRAHSAAPSHQPSATGYAGVRVDVLDGHRPACPSGGGQGRCINDMPGHTGGHESPHWPAPWMARGAGAG